jgi:hypothetical protein
MSYLPRIQLIIEPIGLEELKKAIASNMSAMTNTHSQMNLVLQATRVDIDKQFDENQGTWKKLKKYTVRKKTRRGKDLRILHETKAGGGLRLREAYLKAGEVSANGVLTWGYPVEKPAAKDLDKGKRELKVGATKRVIEAENLRMDREYEDRFDREK